MLFGYRRLHAKLGFSTGVLILSQRQTVLVAKQAACLDVLCGGRFRLGIGSAGTSRVFGAQREFSQSRPPLREQVQVMQKLGRAACQLQGPLAHSRDAGINPRPPRARCRCGMAGITNAPPRIAKWATAGCRTPIRPTRARSTSSANCAA